MSFSCDSGAVPHVSTVPFSFGGILLGKAIPFKASSSFLSSSFFLK
jgi:hypothetical protein